MLMREAATEYKWHLNYAGIALMWRGGCIIRSVFLGDITSAYTKNPKLENLLFDDFFNKAIHKAQPGWRRIIAQTALWGIPTPAFSTALSFFDGYRTERLPASLLQAQRGASRSPAVPFPVRSRGTALTWCYDAVRRLLRRPHLQGPAPVRRRQVPRRQGHPHQLDRTRWRRLGLDVSLDSTLSGLSVPRRDGH